MSRIAEPVPRATLRRLAVLSIFVAGIAGIGVGVVAHLLTDGRAQARGLPEFHGQAGWAPREEPAPPFKLRDQKGVLVSLEALRGRPVLLTFLDSRCEEQCPIMGSQLGTILRDLPPGERPTLLIVSVDPADDTPASIRKAMADWRLTGRWRWHWLRGTVRDLAPVWRDYGITVQPTTSDITHGLVLYLIDRSGFQRAGYLFPFLPNFLALDLRTLAHATAGG